MRNFLRFTWVMLVVILFGCAGKVPGTPVWIQTTANEWQYVLSVGPILGTVKNIPGIGYVANGCNKSSTLTNLADAESFVASACANVNKAAAQSPKDDNFPKIADIQIVSGDPVASSTCTGSTGGYLYDTYSDGTVSGKPSKSVPPETLDRLLKAGYVLTIYPPVNGRIFISEDCRNPKK